MSEHQIDGRDRTQRRAAPGHGAARGLAASADARRSLAQLQHSAGNRAVQRLLRGDGPRELQRFDTGEHLHLGDRGVPRAQAEMVTLAPGYRITYGEMIAMAGDYFGGLKDMQDLAKVGGTGAGTREEIEYIRTVKVRKEKAREAAFSEPARTEANRRYYRLALDNRSHFVSPDRLAAAGTTAERGEGSHQEWRLRWNGIFPRFVSELVVPRAGAGYRHYHLEALFQAYVAGFEGHEMDEALASEAFGAHYLTDAFSGGHLRTARVSISEFWNPKVPMFPVNLKGFMAQALAMRIGDAHWHISREMAYHGALGKPGTLEKVSEALDEKGPMTFGDVVSGAVHDYDSARGVPVRVAGTPVRLVGDEMLDGKPSDAPDMARARTDTRRIAEEAVDLSHNDLTRAWFIGRRHGDLAEVLPAVTKGRLFGAEYLLPVNVADSELPPADRAVKWDFPSADALLDDGTFQLALAEFGRRKARDLAEGAADLPDTAKPHYGPAIVDPFRSEPVDMLRRVLHWTPNTGGGLFGHNQDDNALDYYHWARDAGAVAGLTVPQRVRLIHDLLDGYTSGEEENAVFDLLTAEPADSRTVISMVGWANLEDELGDRFSRRFPEARYR